MINEKILEIEIWLKQRVLINSKISREKLRNMKIFNNINKYLKISIK